MSLRDKFGGKNIKQSKVKEIKEAPSETKKRNAENKSDNIKTGKLKLIDDINKVVPPTEEEFTVQKTEKDSETVEFLIFEINGIVFGIETEFTSEVLPLQYITPVPLSKEFFLGLINVRNEIISVIDLNIIFKNNYTKFYESNKMVILHYDKIQTGIIANKILSIYVTEKENIIANIDGLQLKYEDYIKYIIRFENNDVPVIDLEQILKLNKEVEII